MATPHASWGTGDAPDGATAFQVAVNEHASVYERMRNELRLTDFNPLTVDWTDPVAWGNNKEFCKSDDMSEDSGCMMPLGVGLCARPPWRLPISHPNMRAPPAQRHCLGLRTLLLRCDDRSHFRARTPTPPTLTRSVRSVAPAVPDMYPPPPADGGQVLQCQDDIRALQHRGP